MILGNFNILFHIQHSLKKNILNYFFSKSN